MKKVIEVQYVFRRDFRVRQEVNDEIQTIISYIKYELQNYNEKKILGKTRKAKSFWLSGNGLKEFLTMNPMEKTIKKEYNIRKHDISY